ncbi:MAG: extracellular solute-binding protein [Rhizobiales bacterium]|nr:extracellular solute-binding protein [Hyphomicrobiales bacterium]
MSSRVKFIDRMAQGKISRRDMLKASAAFGVGLVALPRLALADELTVMEWSGYDVPDYCQPFLTKYGKLPNFSIFAAEEDALQKVLGGFAADLMHPCNYSVGRFVEAKLVKPIDTAKLSNWKDLFPALQTAQGVVENGEVVMAPADWGNSSIAYRPDLVEPDYAANESWNIFTDDRYAGKVAMSDNEVAVQICGMLMGYTPDEAFHMEGEKLEAVKPLVEKVVKNSRFLWNDATEINQGLASGEIVAAYAWNDTIKNLTREGIKVAYAKPKEGYFTWFCGITMLNKGKGDEAAAYDFVDAWLSPETGKNLIEGSGYGHSNIKAFEIANKEDVAAMGFTDPIEHMKSAILFPPLTGSSLAAQIKLWEEMKALKQ